MSTEDDEGETATEGRRIGRYELGELLGPASYGSIHRAKVRSGSDAGRRVTARRIEREELDESSIELLSSAGFSAMEVRDPRLAAVLDVVLGDDALTVVSEWVDGALLRDILHHATAEATPCPVPVALRIALDLLEALSASARHWHEIYPEPEDDTEARLRSTIHGGVVPDAVLVASFGETMLCEAGVSGAAMALEPLRHSVGALRLRAPEQLHGAADERADVFSVGVVLWELIAGRSLFGAAPVARRGGGGAVSLRAGSPVAAMRRKLEGGAITRLDTLPKLKDKVSKELSTVVARATDREPKLRYVSLADFKAALSALEIEVAPVEAVAEYVAKVSGAPPEQPSDAVERASNRPTKPPVLGDEDDRETAIPASIDVPPPPEEIASLAPDAPEDGSGSVDFAAMVRAAERDAPPSSDKPDDDEEAASSERGIDLLADDDDDEDGPVSSQRTSEASEAAGDRQEPASARAAASAERTGSKARGQAAASPAASPSRSSAEDAPNLKVPIIAAAVVIAGGLVWAMSSGGGEESRDSASPAEPTPAAPGPAPAPAPVTAPPSEAVHVEPPVADDDAGAALQEAALQEAALEESVDEDEAESEPTDLPSGAPAAAGATRPGAQPAHRAAPKPGAAPEKAFRPEDI